MQHKCTFYITAGILALGFVVGAGLFGHYYYARGQNGSIAVTGSAKRQIKSDVAQLNLNFSVAADLANLTVSTAVAEKDLKIVNDFIKKNGVVDAEITVQPLSVSPSYKHIKQNDFSGTQESDVVSGYSLYQSLSIESGNLDAVSKVANGASGLVSQGVVLSASPVSYLYSKLSDLKKEMLAEATKDARERAQSIAQNAGSSLGALKSAGQGVMQITAPNSTELSDYGSYDTSSIKKEITAIVHASFEVK